MGLIAQVAFAQTIPSHQYVSSATANDEPSLTLNATVTAAHVGRITDKLSFTA